MLGSWAKPLALIAVGMLFGCGPAVRSTSFTTFPARPPDHPIPIYSTQTPECPYEEVGLVTARRRNKLFVSMDEVLKALKQQAREMGGDAVVGVSEGTEARGGVVGENVVAIGQDPVLTGTVIRFSEADCTS